MNWVWLSEMSNNRFTECRDGNSNHLAVAGIEIGHDASVKVKTVEVGVKVVDHDGAGVQLVRHAAIQDWYPESRENTEKTTWSSQLPKKSLFFVATSTAFNQLNFDLWFCPGFGTGILPKFSFIWSTLPAPSLKVKFISRLVHNLARIPVSLNQRQTHLIV